MGTVTGFMKKDLMLFKFILPFLLIISVVYIFFFVFLKAYPLAYLAPLYFGSFIVAMTISNDAAKNWDSFALSFPAVRRDLVKSKYLLFLFFTGMWIVLSLIVTAVFEQMSPVESRDIMGIFPYHWLLTVVGVVFLLQAFVFLATYSFGPKNTANQVVIFFSVLISVSFLIRFSVLRDVEIVHEDFFAAGFPFFSVALFAVSFVVFVLSYFVSVKKYQRTDL